MRLMYDGQGRPNPAFFKPQGEEDEDRLDSRVSMFVLISGDDFEDSSCETRDADEPGSWVQDGFLVKESFRRRGVGSWALEQLLDHRSVQGAEYILAFPRSNDVPVQVDSERPDVRQRALYGATAMFQKAGFRRVSDTTCFAYAKKPIDS
ncbi:hypothetical protein PLICRDRAFT_455818 [Plicaturopsis crispa FD-325 SS-3]|uniref:N-acetyltransferase domain-containing protein n=1 Tax=Plicaturopsis crispa FD-325 SS-3 TaxID=944288 RepID=A0A0C9T583_PLICR|nr:hypothetical protein PLICRDRAFT_455818 [Plicaturopsis crispa FD-325 SS-3]